MMHFGGSKTHECKACGSRLIEDNQCLTCDSQDLKPIQVGIFITYDEPADLDIKLSRVVPALDAFYPQKEIDGDTIHIVPTSDLDKIDTMIQAFNTTHDTYLDIELIKL